MVAMQEGDIITVNQPIKTADNQSSGFETPSGRLIDFHTHILPMMDDGSRSLGESLQMIYESVKQGVCCIVLTPHFYAKNDDPEHFIMKRQRSFALLKQHITTPFPVLIAGAEVEYFEGITTMEELELLCIGNTKLLLVEMLHGKWSTRMIDDILELNSRSNYHIILAHIERYLNDQKEDVIELLIREGVLIQSNASFFIKRFSRRKALNMVSEGRIHLLGSDCHNMTSRRPVLGEAYEIVREQLGDIVTKKMLDHGFQLLMQKAKKSIIRPDGVLI